jgi:hypothetical protein
MKNWTIISFLLIVFLLGFIPSGRNQSLSYNEKNSKTLLLIFDDSLCQQYDSISSSTKDIDKTIHKIDQKILYIKEIRKEKNDSNIVKIDSTKTRKKKFFRRIYENFIN